MESSVSTDIARFTIDPHEKTFYELRAWGPIPIHRAGRLIGFASIDEDLSGQVLRCCIDYHTPERLEMELGGTFFAALVEKIGKPPTRDQVRVLNLVSIEIVSNRHPTSTHPHPISRLHSYDQELT